MYEEKIMFEKSFKKLIVLSAVSTFCLLLFPSPAQGKDRIKNLEKYLELCERYYTFSGSILVAENDRVIYSRGLVTSNFAKRIPNTPDTKFMIGSVSKPFTAMLTLQLVQEGKLSLQGKVSDVLSYYPKDKGSKMTIHHLLCHKAGFKDISKHYPDFFTKVMTKEYTTRQLVKLFCDLPLDFEPGTRYAYSSAGYNLLAAIIEQVTGKPYGRVLREKILTPLGMNNSGSLKPRHTLTNKAIGYDLWNFKYSRADATSPTSHKGAGCIYSTANDLFKFYRALGTEKLLSKKYLHMMFSPQASISGDVGYGYGWAVGKRYVSSVGESLEFFAHGGQYNGFCADFTCFRENKRLIILLANTTDAPLNNIRDQIIALLNQKPYHFRIPISFALDESKSLAQLQQKIKDFKASRDNYTIREDMLNGLGLTYVIRKKLDHAVAVLEFAAAEYPNSKMVADSLAHVKRKAGKQSK